VWSRLSPALDIGDVCCYPDVGGISAVVQEDQQEKPVRTLIAIAAATLVLSLAAPAAVAGPPEYNRGYSDCLAGRYDEGQDSRSYRQGCRAAQEEQGSDERPRHWRPQRGPTIGIPNVRGMEPAQALGAMASRGYRNVGTSVAGGAIAGFYFNPQTGECVQLTSVNGRVVDARDIGTDRRCR
jgi:hypothetical protein